MSKVHYLDDSNLKTNNVIQRLIDESQQEEFVAVLTQHDGSRSWVGPGLLPVAGQMITAFNMALKINKEINHDGAWIIQLIKSQQQPIVLKSEFAEYSSFLFIWMDRDGDCQFTVELDDSIKEIINAGIIHWIDQLEDAYILWKESQEVLELAPGQTVKAAKGERMPLH